MVSSIFKHKPSPGFRLTRQVSSLLAELSSRPQLSSLSKQQQQHCHRTTLQASKRKWIKILITSTGNLFTYTSSKQFRLDIVVSEEGLGPNKSPRIIILMLILHNLHMKEQILSKYKPQHK